MAMKKLTYHNLMVVIHKLEKKGYVLQEAEPIARRIFNEYTPGGLSIEARTDLVLPKKEWQMLQ